MMIDESISKLSLTKIIIWNRYFVIKINFMSDYKFFY